MFIKTHQDNSITLTFLKSANVQAYPCGRRRSTLADRDGDTGTINDQYYFPFDPEARLNTEANNRKHSSLNGFTQTYLKEWDEGSDAEGSIRNGKILLSLCGYLFDIDLSSLKTPNAFGSEIIKQLANTSATSIYANIVLEDVHLFSGFQEYYTKVLRDQLGSDSIAPSAQLDLLKADSSIDVNDFNNYYFSGLSFSTTPLVGVGRAAGYTYTTRDIYVKTEVGNRKATQEIVSLCILEKVKTSEDGVTPEVWEWKIHEPARLPVIEHDVLQDSVKMGETHVRKNLTVDENTNITGNLVVGTEEDLNSSVTVYGSNKEIALDVKGKANVTNNLTVEENITVGDETAAASTVTIYGSNEETALDVKGNASVSSNLTITGSVSTESFNASTAEIETVIATTVTANTALYQKNNSDKIMQVPIIELEQDKQDGRFWQLKISKIGEKTSA